MEILRNNIDAYRKDINRLNIESFPSNERRDLTQLYEDEGESSDIFVLTDEGEFIGFAIVLLTPSIAHLVYFAIEKDHQSKGYGSMVLQHLMDCYDIPLIADVEAPLEEAEDLEQRLHRIHFYHRNGMLMTEIRYKWRGEDYVILSSEPTVEKVDFNKFWGDLEKINPDLVHY